MILEGMTILGFNDRPFKSVRNDQVSISSDDESASQNAQNGDSYMRLLYRHRFGTVELHTQSLDCLNSCSYLSDNIIQFYSAYLINKLNEIQASRFHIFDSIFFEQLSKIFDINKPGIDVTRWRQLSRWYSHVDIFSKDFLLFPVCHRDHWFVIIVCYPRKVQLAFKENDDNVTQEDHEDDEDKVDEEVFKDTYDNIDCLRRQTSQNKDSKTPCIIIMDSLSIRNRSITLKVRDFLDFDWRTKCAGAIKKFSHHDLKDHFPRLPKQKNAYDCGLYMITYMRCFVRDPDRIYQLVIQNDIDSQAQLNAIIEGSVGENDRENLRELILNVCNRDT